MQSGIAQPPPLPLRWTGCQECRGSMVTNSVELSAQRMPSTAKPHKKSRTRRLCTTKSTEQYGKSAANTGWNVGPYCNADTSTQWRGRMLHTLCLVIAQITVTNSTASNGGCSTFTRRRWKISRRSLTCNSLLDGSQRSSGTIPCYIPVPVKRGTGNQIEKRRQENEQRQTDASGAVVGHTARP